MPPDTVVLGVSKDSVKAQKAFAEKHRLAFSLLADADGEVIRRYGVDGLMGFAKRKTFLIDRAGNIAKVYDSVNPLTHARRVATDVAEIP